MNRAEKRARSAAAERWAADREREAFERRVPIETQAAPAVAGRAHKPSRPTSPEATSLADDEPLEGVIPARRRLDLGFGLIVDSKELRIALGEIGQRVALAKEAAVPAWTREEWAASCKGAWDATPKMGPANLREDESYDGTQDRCGRCGLCAWEECLEDLYKRYPLDEGKPAKDRPPPPTIEECVWLATRRTEGWEGKASMGSSLGRMIENADIYGAPRVADPRDRQQVKAAARRIGAWRSGRDVVEINGRKREVATPWTHRVESNPTRSMQAKTPEWARSIEHCEEYAISWRFALSDLEARGGLTEREAEALVRAAKPGEASQFGLAYDLGLSGDATCGEIAAALGAKVGRNPEQVRAIVGAVLSRYRADLAARRFLPPVHPRNGAFRLYQERLAVRLGVHERAAAREARG